MLQLLRSIFFIMSIGWKQSEINFKSALNLIFDDLCNLEHILFQEIFPSRRERIGEWGMALPISKYRFILAV